MAQRIFKNQTALDLTLDTTIDLTTATDVWMKYKKPDGTIGIWDATIDDPVTDGIIRYIIQSSSDLDQLGEWTRWAYIEINSTKYAPGDSVTFEVYKEGE
jgi:hypothetical protein